MRNPWFHNFWHWNFYSFHSLVCRTDIYTSINTTSVDIYWSINTVSGVGLTARDCGGPAPRHHRSRSWGPLVTGHTFTDNCHRSRISSRVIMQCQLGTKLWCQCGVKAVLKYDLSRACAHLWSRSVTPQYRSVQCSMVQCSTGHR